MKDNGRVMTLPALYRANIKNRFPQLLIIVLILSAAIAFQIYYSSWLKASQTNDVMDTIDLQFPFFDLLIFLENNDQPVPVDRYPNINSNGPVSARTALLIDQAVLTRANSKAGEIMLLCLVPESTLMGLPESSLQGRLPIYPGEILLPRSYAETGKVELGKQIPVLPRWLPGESSAKSAVMFRTTGIYDDIWNFPLAVTTKEDEKQFPDAVKENCLLVRINRQVLSSFSVGELNSYMRRLHPSNRFLSSLTPSERGVALLLHRFSTSFVLLILFLLFLFVGIQTIVLMDFQKRRKEFASLKSIGLSWKELCILFCGDYLSAFAVAVGLAHVLIFFLQLPLPWLQDSISSILIASSIQASLASLLIILAALVFPLLTICLASVNNLLYTRQIPLFIVRVNRLLQPRGNDVMREREENLRLIRIPFGTDSIDVMILKTIGTEVKKGEVIAFQRSCIGLIQREWCAWCDGYIETIEINGIIAIRPSHFDTPFYPYPAHLIHDEERKRLIHAQQK